MSYIHSTSKYIILKQEQMEAHLSYKVVTCHNLSYIIPNWKMAVISKTSKHFKSVYKTEFAFFKLSTFHLFQKSF